MGAGESAMANNKTPTAEQQEPKLYNGKTFQELPFAEQERLIKEQALKNHPTLTAEEYEEMKTFYGF